MAKELTLAELQKQIAELQAKEKEIIQAEKATVVEEIKAKIAQYKLTFEELGFSAPFPTTIKLVAPEKNGNKGKDKAPLIPVYRNKDNESEAWHGGKGAYPKWIENLINANLADKKEKNSAGNMVVPKHILIEWLDNNGYRI